MSTISNLLGLAVDNRLCRYLYLPPEVYDAHYLSRAISAIESRRSEDYKDLQAGISPIFIFAAGWGSGSTLLQRIVMSSDEVLVWGEPYDRGAPVQRISSTLLPISDNWPPDSHFQVANTPSALSTKWVANLAPSISSLRAAHLAYFDQLFASQAANRNSGRWGLKEVRLTIDHARYFKWLYPNAKFLFLYRDLMPGYLGCRRREWYSVWPRYKATNIIRFAHHWQHLVTGFIEGYKDVDGLLVKYEDLVSGALSLEAIREYLDVNTLDEGILDKKLGSRSKAGTPLILPERIILNGVAGKTRKMLGYKS